MDQTYVLWPRGSDGCQPCLYRYGNYCYFDRLPLKPCTSAEELPDLLAAMQDAQASMPFLVKYDALEEGSDNWAVLSALDNAVDFIVEEMLGSESMLEEAMSDNDWIDQENAQVYFEFETVPGYSVHTASTIISKRYVRSVLLTIIFWEGRFLVTLAEVSEEQSLVDSMLPSVAGRRRGFQVRAYNHPAFTKLSLWEAAGAPVEEEDDAAEDTASDSKVDKISTLNLAGDGYVQTYILLRPHALSEGSTARRAFFRFGNWCYSGQIDLGVESLHLGDVPQVLPALQKQQSLLGFTCEASAVPATSPYAPILAGYNRAVEGLINAIVESEDQLSKMAEIGVTAWIDEDWGAAFFDMQMLLGADFANIELVAGKVYGRGLIVYTVLFGNSLYAVLADADDDQPLLDVAFPDVTARCRGFQIRSYDDVATPGLTRRRLSVWEGRRRGAVGVGWGSAGALRAGGAAKPKDYDSGAVRAAAAAAVAAADAARERSREAALARSKPQTPAKPASPSSSKLADDAPTSPSKVDSDAASSSKATETPSKVTEDERPVVRVDADASGKRAESSPAKRSELSEQFKVRAPHHLPPMGGGSRLASIQRVEGTTPWDASGKPVLGKGLK